MFTRRQTLELLLLSTVFPVQVAHAAPQGLKLHNKKGSDILNKVLNNPGYWSKAGASTYQGEHYDEIRLSEQSDGYLMYVSGEGKKSFKADDVAETIFKHQDLIQQFMPELRSAKYLGQGTDSSNACEYTDIYFLVDLKILFLAVPLRTYKIKIDDSRYICAIELLTESMVSKQAWPQYQSAMKAEQAKLGDLWFFQNIASTEFLYGYYLIEPGTTHESRVTLVAQVKIKREDSLVANVASELPFILRQGIKAGFIGSVLACLAYQEQNR